MKWLFIRDLHYELGMGWSMKYPPCQGYLPLLGGVGTLGFDITEFILAGTLSCVIVGKSVHSPDVFS